MNKSLTKNIDLTKINDDGAMKQVAQDLLVKMRKEGKTLSEVVGLDHSLLEQTYAYAYTHYNAGKYQDALQLFEFLTHMDSKSFKFVFGYAACYYQMKNYELASFLFFAALNLESNNALAAYHLADCFLKKGMVVEGHEVLDMTIDLASQNKEYAYLKERARLMKGK